MKRIENVMVAAAVVAMLLACGARTKATYHSPRRVLALRLSVSPALTLVKYLPDAQEEQVFDLDDRRLRGTLTASTISSNATAWTVQLLFEASPAGGVSFRSTNILDIVFPQSRQVSIPELGAVTGWFLSDQELGQLDGMFDAPK